MRRLFFAILIVSTLLLSAAVAAASWLGGYTDSEIATLIAARSAGRANIRTTIQFVDLRHGLTVAFVPRTSLPVRSMMLDDAQHAFMLTQRSIGAQGRTLLELYHADLTVRGMPQTRLITFPNIALQDVFGVDALLPSWSPDGRLLAFYHPVESQVFVFDTETKQRRVLSNPVTAGIFRGSLSWSPDGSYVAFREAENRLIVASSDGSSVRRFEMPDIRSFRPVWSEDGQRILISYARAVEGHAPIRVLDVDTIEPDEQIASIGGIDPQWCDDRWIMYLRRQPNGRQIVHVLDTLTGSDTQVNADTDMPLNIQQMWIPSFDKGCLRIFLNWPSGIPQLNSVYIWDADGQEFQLVHERVWHYSDRDGEVIYTASESDAYVVYRASLDDPGQKQRLARFQATRQMQTRGFSVQWLDSVNMGLLFTPGGLYQLNVNGLKPISNLEDNVFQYAVWE